MCACALVSQVKAWCYYESRCLGAHHGLLSTYGLEVLVLYIFNLYHRQIQSPLEVGDQTCAHSALHRALFLMCA